MKTKINFGPKTDSLKIMAVLVRKVNKSPMMCDKKNGVYLVNEIVCFISH